jgi:hypothetical protein
MRLEADRMTGLALDDKVVLPERDVVLEERRMRIDNEPASLLAEQLHATLFLHHPYRNPTIGWVNEIRLLGTEDALASYRKWYAPNNAILVIAGDVDSAEVGPLAERYFGPIPPQSLPARVRVEEPPHYAAARLEMKSARAAQPQWNRSYLAPSYRAGETAQAYPLQVLAEILGGGAGSRLYKTLVLDRGLALSAGAHYSPSTIDLAIFGLYATPKPGVSVADLETAIDGELRRLVRDGVDPDELRRAKERMQAASVYARDSLSGPPNIIGAALYRPAPGRGRSVARPDRGGNSAGSRQCGALDPSRAELRDRCFAPRADLVSATDAQIRRTGAPTVALGVRRRGDDDRTGHRSRRHRGLAHRGSYASGRLHPVCLSRRRRARPARQGRARCNDHVAARRRCRSLRHRGLQDAPRRSRGGCAVHRRPG